MGFDTIFESDYTSSEFYQQLESQRILLTRIAKIRRRPVAGRSVFIEADRVFEQLKQVFDELAITRRDIRVFSLCLRCNSRIVAVNKSTLAGRVPDYIWDTHDGFQMCRRCERIFWAGSHRERTMEKIEGLFIGKNPGNFDPPHCR